MKLRFSSETPKPNSKIVDQFITHGSETEITDNHCTIYFVCDVEKPVRFFEIKVRHTTTFLTCHILYRNMTIVCNPIAEGPMYYAIVKQKKTMALEATGYVTNAPYPKNEQKIKIEFIVKSVDVTEGKYINKMVYLETVRCHIPIDIASQMDSWLTIASDNNKAVTEEVTEAVTEAMTEAVIEDDNIV